MFLRFNFLIAFVCFGSIHKSVSFEYPQVRRDETKSEVKNGNEIKDPYHWLEDLESEETERFINEQNKVTDPYLKSYVYREDIRRSIKELNNYPQITAPRKQGSKYFYYMKSGEQNFAIFYQKDSLDSEPKVFIDQNTLSNDGTASISYTSFSEDGQWCAYGISFGGSDWSTIKIKNVETGQQLNDTITNVKFSIPAWTHDNRGFFYARYGESTGIRSKSDNWTILLNQKLYYHQLNTDQSQDLTIAKLPNSKWRFNQPLITSDGKYLHVFPREGVLHNLWYMAKLDRFKNQLRLIPIIDQFKGDFYLVDNENEIHYIMTNYKAPNFKMMAVNILNPGEENWIEVIPESPSKTLIMISPVHKDLYAVVYMENVDSKIEFYQRVDVTTFKKYHLNDGHLDLKHVSIHYMVSKKNDPEMFLAMSSFITPTKIVYYNFNSTPAVIKTYHDVSLKNFKTSDYIVKQVFYKSKDKTAIPMYLVHHKDLELNGNNPTMLWGYGGFSIPSRPAFGLQQILMIKQLKGVYAVANIRGGGEYGERWHEAGMLFNKQNVFDDFISAAEYLIINRYTNRDMLTIYGRSNGGLLISAVANQRPDLFGCALPQVGVMDMLKFHKFTIGHAWTEEYGNPEVKEEFVNILKYSPLHNIPVNATRFPATLVLTADHDDRVVPSHSLKYAAQLQYLLGERLPTTPLMIKITSKSGHGNGKSTALAIEEMTDIFSFIIKSMDLHFFADSSSQLTSFNQSTGFVCFLFVYIWSTFIIVS